MGDLAIGLMSLTGAFFLLTAGIGLVRMPDVYCRGHTLGLAGTLGVVLLLLALGLEVGGVGTGIKVGAAILLQFATIPIASHLVGMLALNKRVRRHSGERPRSDD